MGCGGSTPVEAEDPMTQRSRAIDKELAQEKTRIKNTTKILLLGAGESGKSTVLKQMRLRYADQYSKEELAEYVSVLWSNAIQSMQAILDAAESFQIPFDAADSQRIDVIKKSDAMLDILPLELVDALRVLARHPTVQSVLERSSEFQNDSAKYFFENIDRITRPDYTPTTADVLRARVKTTGITENKFQVDNKTLIVVDVGGQRSERRKWLQCFQDVDVLMFLFSVSEFDQVLYEDENVRRFEEAMNVFQSICNSAYFKDSLIILLLNKIDLLEGKLQRKRFADFYPNYTGPTTTDGVLAHLQSGLVALHKGDTKKAIYAHRTCATDTRTINVVLAAIQDQILSRILNEVGIF